MKTLLALFLIPQLLCAQPLSDKLRPANSNVMMQEGQLLSIRLVVGEPIRIFVVGREEAKVNLSDLKVTVRRIKPYPGKVLATDRNDDYFEITEPLDLKQSTDLEVTTKVNDKVETHHFKLNNRMP